MLNDLTAFDINSHLPEPALSMVITMSALLSAGASFTPSPVIDTMLPLFSSASTNRYFYSCAAKFVSLADFSAHKQFGG